MIDWIKTAQGVAAIVAAIFVTMVAWWSLGLPRLKFSPRWCPFCSTTSWARSGTGPVAILSGLTTRKRARQPAPLSQRRSVAQMSDALLLDLNANSPWQPDGPFDRGELREVALRAGPT